MIARGASIITGFRFAPYFLVVTITIAAFWPIFSANFIRFDDTVYVTDNPGVKQGLSVAGLRYAATAIVCGHYHPLTVLSHQLDVTLFGLRPFGHHAVNLLFHVANACLLFHVLRTMTNALAQSLFVALLFAIHPLHVESVAWVSERKDVLSTFFTFLSMGAYVKFVRSGKRKSYFLSVICFALALLAKPMPVTLPFVLLLLDYWPLCRTALRGLREYARELPALAMEKLPYFLLSVVLSVVTYFAQRSAGATRGTDVLPVSGRFENAIVAYASYVEKIFVPIGLAPHYPLTNYSAAQAGACLLVLIVITFAAFITIRRMPYFFVGWFWFVGMLVPVIGLVQAGNQAMADRFTYVPMVGIAIAILWLVTDGLPIRAPRISVYAVAALVISILSTLTFQQVRLWRDTETLFTHTLAVSPNSALAHKVLGLDFEKRTEYSTALYHFEHANTLDPRDRDNAFNLGTALLRLNRSDDAIPWLTTALTTYDKPADAYTNLGRALLQKDIPSEAKPLFVKALDIDNDQIEARINLGIAQGMLGDTHGAVTTLAEAVRRAPENADAHYNYGVALKAFGNLTGAELEFEQSDRLEKSAKE